MPNTPGIHDEAEVEKVALAIRAALLAFDPNGYWPLTMDEIDPNELVIASAALSAIDVAGIRAKAIEECALIADRMYARVNIGDGEYGGGIMNASKSIANSIRALSMGKENGE